jgi:hypothetical protein
MERIFLEMNQSETGIAWKVIYKYGSLHPDPLTNMAITDNSCF